MSVQPSNFDRTKYCSKACRSVGVSRRMTGNKYRVGMKPGYSFEPGHAPWNKGLKGIRLSPGSEFKKGRASEKARPVGSTRIQHDKNGAPRVFVKVAEPRTWEPRARIVWSEHRGPIPRDMIVHHENRDTMDDRIENLRLITRAEHIREHREEYEAKRAATVSKSWTDERKAAHRLACKGRPCSPGTRAKIGAANKARAAERKLRAAA